jgi:hypothetical protein
VTVDAAHDELLSNVLQTLDRLYDRETSAVDVQAVIYATYVAMASSDLEEPWKTAGEGLPFFFRDRLPAEEENTAALAATGELRRRIAAIH